MLVQVCHKFHYQLTINTATFYLTFQFHVLSEITMNCFFIERTLYYKNKIGFQLISTVKFHLCPFVDEAVYRKSGGTRAA